MKKGGLLAAVAGILGLAAYATTSKAGQSGNKVPASGRMAFTFTFRAPAVPGGTIENVTKDILSKLNVNDAIDDSIMNAPQPGIVNLSVNFPNGMSATPNTGETIIVSGVPMQLEAVTLIPAIGR